MIKVVQTFQFKVILFLLIILALLTDILFLKFLIALCLSIYVFIILIKNIIEGFAYFEIIYFICIIQMVVLPFFNRSEILDLNRYFLIVLPGILFFILGVNTIKSRNVINPKALFSDLFKKKKNRFIAIFFIVLGLIGTIIPSFTDDSLINIISNFSPVGIALCYGLMYYNKRKYAIYPLLFGFIILIQCVVTAVFAPIISFAFLSFAYLPTVLSLSRKKLMLMMFGGILFLGILQNVKTVYRESVWAGSQRDFSFSIFWDSLFDFSNKDKLDFSGRASAGTTISMIYDYVPDNYPHTYGMHLMSDLTNAVLPRFIFPDKLSLSSQANFARYTGITLQENVSVGINMFGIAYAEFGVTGSWLFFFLFGIILNQITKSLIFISRKSKKWIVLPLFLPVIFSCFFSFEVEFYGQIVAFLRIILFVVVMIKFLELLRFNFALK